MAKREIEFGVTEEQMEKAFDRALEKLLKMKEEIDKGNVEPVQLEVEDVAKIIGDSFKE